VSNAALIEERDRSDHWGKPGPFKGRIKCRYGTKKKNPVDPREGGGGGGGGVGWGGGGVWGGFGIRTMRKNGKGGRLGPYQGRPALEEPQIL